MVLQHLSLVVIYTIRDVDLCVHYGCNTTCYIPALTVRYTQQNTKGENTMKTTFYLDGKKTTKNAVKELIGEERLKRIIEEAKETFFEDPLVQNDFFIGNGMLTIEFA